MRPPEETRADYLRLLNLVYCAVDWRKVARGHSPYDIWNHRVRASATRPTLGASVSWLYRYD